MATIAAPTVFNTLCRPRTHAENPHSLLAARVITVGTGSSPRAVATIELWQSTVNNALAKVFRDPLQTLEGCHPPPLSLSLGLVLLAWRRLRLGLKEWHLDGKFAAELLLQSRNSLKIVAVPALFLRVPAKPERLEGVFVLEGLSIDAEAGKGKVEDHCDWFGPTPWVLSLGTFLNNYLSLTKNPPTTHAGTATIPAPAAALVDPHPLYFPNPPALSNAQSVALVTQAFQFQGILYLHKKLYLYLLSSFLCTQRPFSQPLFVVTVLTVSREYLATGLYLVPPQPSKTVLDPTQYP
jgi:hypothetical protein